MEMFVSVILPVSMSMRDISMEAEWRCATMRPIIQSVMRDGPLRILWLSVTRWAIMPHTIVSDKSRSVHNTHNSI